MKLEELERSLKREYLRLRKEASGQFYVIPLTAKNTFSKLAALVDPVIKTEEDVAVLIRAAFSVKWWLNQGSNWVESSVPYPNQLLKVAKYLPVFERMRRNGEVYSFQEQALTAVDRSYFKMQDLVKSSGNYSSISFFLDNGTISEYYAIAHISYLSDSSRRVCEHSEDSQVYKRHLRLETLKNKLALEGLLGPLRKRFKELSGR